MGKKRFSKLKNKLAMYDTLIANLIAGKSIIEPRARLDNTELYIGFNSIASQNQISKYFIINKLPDYLPLRVIDLIRNTCIRSGVKINFYIYGNPHKIDWNSYEMRNKLAIWKEYYNKDTNNVDIFNYRFNRDSSLNKQRIAMSTKYLNEAELEHKRKLLKISIVIEVSANRDNNSILNMGESIRQLRRLCIQYDIKIKEIRINILDWLKKLGIFSLMDIKEVDNKLSKRAVTDDILAYFNSYKQGRVGNQGICLGMDILSNEPVLKKFKEHEDMPENWLIVAESGGGKSYLVKTLLSYLLADNFVVMVMDYEGDEYNNLANYIRAGNPDDVKIVSMGKGSTIYFDPLEISELTGNDEIDEELKEIAVNYALAIFKVIVAGLNGTLTQWEESVISLAIKRVYEAAGVTDDKYTWHRSKGLRLHMVYNEIKDMVESKELVDYDNDNVMHRAALKILESTSIYFEEGGSKSGTFKNSMSANELYKAKFIVFSFGMRGSANSLSDQTILALKQLSVSFISTQISNYCKYVKKCFNVKVWEEFQRWGIAKGSSEIILNAITGGRKRGDVNFIITNNLAEIIDGDNPVTSGIRQNIQNIAIGKVVDKVSRKKFCEVFDIPEIEGILDRIAKAHMTDYIKSSNNVSNRYKHAFCLILDNGNRAIVKAMLPKVLLESRLFRTGVEIENR